MVVAGTARIKPPKLRESPGVPLGQVCVMAEHSFEAAAECLDRLMGEHPQMVERIYRQLLIALHTRGIVSVDRIADETRELFGQTPPPRVTNPNAPTAQRFNAEARAVIHALTPTAD